jgi:hypothetical protein
MLARLAKSTVSSHVTHHVLVGRHLAGRATGGSSGEFRARPGGMVGLALGFRGPEAAGVVGVTSRRGVVSGRGVGVGLGVVVGDEVETLDVLRSGVVTFGDWRLGVGLGFAPSLSRLQGVVPRSELVSRLTHNATSARENRPAPSCAMRRIRRCRRPDSSTNTACLPGVRLFTPAKCKKTREVTTPVHGSCRRGLCVFS